MRAVAALLGVAMAGCAPTVVYLDGVPNLAQVGPGVYRSAQPTTRAEWLAIRRLGVRHVLKLNFPSEGSDDLAVRMYFDVHTLSLQPAGDADILDSLAHTFVRPLPAVLDEIERLLESASPDNAWLVHCTHGQDRTGFVVGRYRVLHDRWSKADAYREMRAHGFHPLLHGLNDAWEDWGR